jgi:hypothetical protein
MLTECILHAGGCPQPVGTMSTDEAPSTPAFAVTLLEAGAQPQFTDEKLWAPGHMAHPWGWTRSHSGHFYALSILLTTPGQAGLGPPVPGMPAVILQTPLQRKPKRAESPL